MRFGPYVVLSELGRGGMGLVYHARHEQTGQEVALKVLTEVRGPEDVQRFEREGQAVARLRHPGIVQVHAAGTEAGRPWLAMELVRGQSLRERLRREGPLEPGAARRMFARLAAALEHAHRHDVLHRDLKPENIIIDPTGEPRLIDFGLAQVNDRSRLTRTGELAGTAAYMAPEQAVGDRDLFGAWTDVYGLGATLYDALTGHPPFAGSGLVVLDRVVRQPPRSPAELRPGLDPGLARVCLACLEKEPGLRPPTAAAFAQLLSGRRAARPRRRRAWVAAGLGLLGAASAAGLVVARRAPGPAPAGDASPVASSPAPVAPATPIAPAEDPADALAARADALAAAGDRARAIEALAQALAAAPGRADLRVRRGVLRLDAKDGQGALDDLEAALEAAPSVAGYVARAKVRVAANQVPAAETDLRSALSLDPRSADARVAYAALLDLTGETVRAREEVAEALRLAPTHVDGLRLASKLRYGDGDLPGALALLDEVLAQRPDHPESLANRANLRAALKDDAGCVADLLRVNALTGGLAFHEYVTLAKACFRLQAWADADRAYARARELDPRQDPELTAELRREGDQVRARALAEEAQAEGASGRAPRAVELLTQALELDPGFTRALLERARARRAAGDLEGARADLALGASRAEASTPLGRELREEQAALGP